MSDPNFSASKAHRWRRCIGSIHAVRKSDEEENLAELEGLAMHEIAEKELKSYKNNEEIYIPKIGDVASNAIDMTDEMLSCVSIYTNDVLKEIMKFGGVKTLGVERHLFAKLIAKNTNQIIDAYAINHKDKEITIWEFKTGRRFVSEIDNDQLIMNAIAILGELEEIQTIEDVANCDWTIKMRVVQPRCYHPLGSVRTFTVKASEYLPHHIEDMRDIILRSKNGDKSRQSGDHCYKCPAFNSCDANIKSVLNLCEHLDLIGDPINISNDDLSVLITILRDVVRRASKLKEGLEAEAESKLKNGSLIPGYTLTSGKNYKYWNCEKEKIYIIGEMFGVDLREDKPVSPTAAEKLIVNGDISKYIKHGKGKSCLNTIKNSLPHIVFQQREEN